MQRRLLVGKQQAYYACGPCWLLDSTITGNQGSIDFSVFDTLTVRNSIVRGNANDSFCLCGELYASSFLFGFAVPGIGNLIAAPQLWSAPSGNARLAPGSPYIDAGDPTSPLDPDGSRRDLGAFAFDPAYAPGPTVYCTAKVSSLGCTRAIAASGLASATSATPFQSSCGQQISQRMGILTSGYQPLAAPYHGGFMCVQAPSSRTPPQNSGGSPGGGDCSGVFPIDFNAHIQSGVDPALAPGVIVDAQYWARDPAASFANHRSDAVWFGVAP